MIATATPMHLDLASVCGCGLVLDKDHTGRVTVTLRSDDTEVTRRFPEVDPAEIDPFFEFAWSVAVAVEADEDEGTVRSNFVDPSLFCTSLGLEMRFDLVDDRNDHLRMEVVLLSKDEDSLDYCHVGVTLDLSLRYLRAATEEAVRDHPYIG